MMRQYEIRGVPRSIALDSWWLDKTGSPENTAAGKAGTPGGTRPGIAPIWGNRWLQLLLIVLLADFLFWQQSIGISLMVFALGLVLIAGWRRPPVAQIKAGVICLLGALPVAEHVQLLSVVFLVAGVVLAVVTLQEPAARWHHLAARVAGFLAGLPGHWWHSLFPGRSRGLRLSATSLMSTTRRISLWRDWAFPLGGSLVFLALLMDANPLFLTLGTDYVDLWALVRRVLFWSGVVVVTAPLLMPAAPREQLPDLPVPRLPGLNMRSVLRALLMFNALIGVQMVTDLAILTGGADLPDGMGYAEYAHRGAYPLLATAMLAIAFAVAARPFWHEHRLIRPLMLLWLLQNILLAGAAALRNELYIEAYGLTYLRLYALIWMGLVAVSLGLAIVQMALNQTTLWLALRAAVLGAVTLYLCAFVNFAAVIAAQNLSRPQPDMGYVCALGPMAAAEIVAAEKVAASLLQIMGPKSWRCDALTLPRIDGWRDWGLRSWRVTRMLGQSVPERAE